MAKIYPPCYKSNNHNNTIIVFIMPLQDDNARVQSGDRDELVVTYVVRQCEISMNGTLKADGKADESTEYHGYRKKTCNPLSHPLSMSHPCSHSCSVDIIRFPISLERGIFKSFKGFYFLVIL